MGGGEGDEIDCGYRWCVAVRLGEGGGEVGGGGGLIVKLCGG